MQRRHMLSALAAVSFVPGMSLAQEVKPLRIIVPFPPGGATDITARSLQESLARILKQPVVLENRGGAGGSIGMAEVARASADGLTLGVATLSTHGVNPAVYSKLPYDPIKDFVGVTEIVKAPGVVVVNPAVLRAVGYDPEDWSGFAFGSGWGFGGHGETFCGMRCAVGRAGDQGPDNVAWSGLSRQCTRPCRRRCWQRFRQEPTC